MNETNAPPEPTDEIIDASSVEGDTLFEVLLMAAVGRETIYPEQYESGAIVYSAWVSATRYLANIGWTTEELSRDVAAHAADDGAK